MNEKKIVSAKRIYMKKGYKFKQQFRDVDGNIYYRNIEIIDKIGEGSSCICYDVNVETDKDVIQRMVMKQFYPLPDGEGEFEAELQGAELTILNYEHNNTVKELGKRFEEAYELQNRFANQEQKTMQVVVKPLFKYFEGSVKLAFYVANG